MRCVILRVLCEAGARGLFPCGAYLGTSREGNAHDGLSDYMETMQEQKIRQRKKGYILKYGDSKV